MNRKIEKLWKRESGITMISLVITIIVLLILASVTIKVTLNTEIVEKTKNTATEYKESESNQTNQLSNLKVYIDADVGYTIKATTVKEAKEEGEYYNSNTEITDSSTTPAKIKVPAGFKIASDSATKVAEGVVIEDKAGNQYVWIPCTIDGANGSLKYDRYDFQKQDGYYGGYSENMSSDNNEQNSIKDNGGYYIGRYEAGINSQRTESGDKTKMTMADLGEVLEKNNQFVYNYVTIDQAKKLAVEVSSHYDYSLMSELCNSYAWDTALKFIDATVDGYSTNTTQGNYNNTSFTYTDINGNTQTKGTGTSTLIPTGKTTSVCNIYDMGGNTWEWITESYANSSSKYVYRGGSIDNSFSNNPAGCRSYDNNTCSHYNIGFRVTLYL